MSFTGSIPTEGPSEKKKTMRKSRAKPKPDIDLETEEPFKARKIQVMETSYVDQTPLDLANTCIFKGEFYDLEKRKVRMVLLPDSFFNLHQAEPNMQVFRQVINKDGVATLSMLEGETVQVHISEDLISEALHLPKSSAAYKMPYHLREQDRKQLFLQKPGKKETFNELICKELDLPLKLYSQHFVIGKPQKYTQPCKRVAGHMHRAITQGKTMPGDLSFHIRQDLIAHRDSKSLKEKPHLANGQMLTRIAYQALGMIEELPKAVSQE